ncbi:MAG: hypothetical protein IT206_05740 [Fimbriimonadaceae bacterium]|nr:hypothetical protein [Fimbriimonadaceae bacterium]
MGQDTKVKAALESQYLGTLSMMRECISLATPEIWVAGKWPRSFWRIAFHGLFYTDLYSGQTANDHKDWPGTSSGGGGLWEDDDDDRTEGPYAQEEMIKYCDWLAGEIPKRLAAMDLDSETCGIPWYEPFPKLDHQVLNIRHLAGHVGQLSELLMASGVDSDFWKSRGYKNSNK